MEKRKPTGGKRQSTGNSRTLAEPALHPLPLGNPPVVPSCACPGGAKSQPQVGPAHLMEQPVPIQMAGWSYVTGQTEGQPPWLLCRGLVRKSQRTQGRLLAVGPLSQGLGMALRRAISAQQLPRAGVGI